MQYTVKFTLYPIHIAALYLVMITLAELVTAVVDPWIGIGIHLLLLAIIIGHAVTAWYDVSRRFLLTLLFVPMIRMLSLSLPLTDFPLAYWFLITSIPLFALTLMVMRALELGWRQVGVHGDGLLLQLAFVPTGFLLGFVEYFILRPDPLVETFTWQAVLIPALILLISTGLFEELAFRGIMQSTAIEVLGGSGIAYVALIFAALHIGYQSLLDVIFVFGVGLFFGWFVQRTGSIIGVTLSHGLTNIFLFLVMPFFFAGYALNPPPPLSTSPLGTGIGNVPILSEPTRQIDPTPTETASATPAATASDGDLMADRADRGTTEAIVAPTATFTPSPTATASATATSTPSSTPTFTSSPTSSPTPPPTATPSPTATPLPAFVPLQPVDGYAGEPVVTFEWQLNIPVEDAQRLELVFWQAGQNPLEDGIGLMVDADARQVQVNLRQLDIMLRDAFEPGTYQWGLLLVETEPSYRRLQYVGGGRTITFIDMPNSNVPNVDTRN